ncbi:MICOS complex subunit MIC10 [Lotus japonicus]|uniref:MICOS complex subunit MIC10 n=1 Tax=Lotus japonicus TaxID=34305 RepID=I3T2E9_LOTJA|nr:MICOS complex subunit MIC10 [Lotus japonicus]AFK46691.1 unknown [Lotus japonicus]
MADNKEIIPPQYDLDAKWDACLDLTVRRFVYSSFAGALGGLLFFRSPVTRWASIAFGAGVGIGSAYTESSRLFDGPPRKLALPEVSETPIQSVQDSE